MKRRRRLLRVAALAWLLPVGGVAMAAGSPAAPAAEAAVDDRPAALVVDEATELGAALGELRRGVKELQLSGSPTPYAAELRLVRAETLTVRGKYGGVVHDLHERQAFGSVAVAVGSRERDNSSFFGGDQEPGFPLPLDPDVEGTRRAVWLGMDRAFRAATRVYAAKEAAYARAAEPAPAIDRAPPPPSTVAVAWNDDHTSLADPRLRAADFDREAYRRLVADLSRRFADHPQIDDGEVFLQVFRTYDAVVSTEDLVVAGHRDRAVLAVIARTQAADGMELDHGAVIHLPDLPVVDDGLRGRAAAMVDATLVELEALMNAPMLDEDYDGPILFADEAAAQLLASTLAIHASGTPAPMSEFGRMSELEPHWLDRLGREVMPRFLSVEDDPFAPGFGHYDLDAQGYRPEALRLVDHGRLSRVLMTRAANPSVEASNGHARSATNLTVGPSVSNVTVRSDRRGLGKEKMYAALLDRAADDGYDFAYVIEELRDGNVLGVVPRDSASDYASGRKVAMPLPARIYKLERVRGEGGRSAGYRTTLVRGALLVPASMRVLRRIREVGDRGVVVPMRLPPGMGGGFTADIGIDALLSQTVDVQISSPSLLIEGMELTVERGENKRLPTLVHPLRRSAAPP